MKQPSSCSGPRRKASASRYRSTDSHKDSTASSENGLSRRTCRRVTVRGSIKTRKPPCSANSHAHRRSPDGGLVRAAPATHSRTMRRVAVTRSRISCVTAGPRFPSPMELALRRRLLVRRSISSPAARQSAITPARRKTNTNLRSQISIANVAPRLYRGIGWRITRSSLGVEGRVLLGPRGAPGRYEAPVRIRIRHTGSETFIDRVVRASATLESGSTQANFNRQRG